jgi:hypothetical protein
VPQVPFVRSEPVRPFLARHDISSVTRNGAGSLVS